MTKVRIDTDLRSHELVRIDVDSRSHEYRIVEPNETYVGAFERTGHVTGETLARWRKAIKEFNRAQKEMSEI